MGVWRPPTRGALAALCFATALLSAVPAFAQSGRFGPRAERGFGNRNSILFSVENIFGYEHAETKMLGSSSTRSTDSGVMYPLYWGNVGVFVAYDSGLTFGGLVGASHYFVDSSNDFTFLRLEPRIGYAGSVDEYFGYWVRGGPSLFSTFSGDEKSNIFAAGAEAYAVITPVPHLNVLVGPNADISIYGRDNHGTKQKFTEYGLMCGLMGEFW